MPANDTVASTALQQYLSRLDSALGGLPESERRDIILETRSHVAEHARRSPQLSVPEILAELGAPETYAQTFAADARPTSAGTSGRAAGALAGIARLATGSWTALPLLLLVLSCYSVAVFLLFIAVTDILEPANTGLVVKLDPPLTFAFVASDPDLESKGRDVLGAWIVPIALSIAAAIHFAMSALLRRVLPRPARAHSSGNARSHVRD